VSPKKSKGKFELSVEDDGRASDHVVKSGMGLLGMRERVASLGGRLGFEAGRERGATLLVVIPLAHTKSSRRARWSARHD